jgi:hypothetical protein
MYTRSAIPLTKFMAACLFQQALADNWLPKRRQPCLCDCDPVIDAHGQAAKPSAAAPIPLPAEGPAMMPLSDDFKRLL